MKILPVFFLIGLIAAFGAVGNADLEDQSAQDKEYCELVALWKSTSGDLGIPPYRTNIDCEVVK